MADSIVDTEQQFQELLQFLSSSIPTGQCFLAVHRFMVKLAGNPSGNVDYILELAEYVPDLAGNMDDFGISPDLLSEFLQMIRRLQSSIPDMQKIADLNSAVKALEYKTAALYRLVGESRKADSICAHAGEKTLDGAKKHASGDALSVVVPVIELLPFNGYELADQGNLRRIGMRIWRDSRDGRDHLDWQVMALETDKNGANTLDAPIQAARLLLGETVPHLKNKYLTGQVIFEAPHAMHKGCSANLALAALFYCSVLEHFSQREQFHLNPNIAITGNIDADGKVLPVDAPTLACKIEAVFFSWIEYLIIPQQQMQSAKKALAALSAKFPNRSLALIGVEHLKELFYDRRITGSKKPGAFAYATKKLWHAHQKKLAVSAILILLTVIGKLLYGPFDKNPVAAEFAGESLLIKNKSGEIVDNIWVGPATVRRANSVGNDDELLGLHYVAFFDVDGDSINEVFWVQWTDEKTGQSGKICSKSLQEDTVRWSISLRRALDFPRKPDVRSDHFYPNQIAAGDFDGDGRGELFVNSTHEFFPSLVMKLEAKTGKELGHYVHVGHLPSMKLIDLDNDGITEVLLCGVNNAFRKACLVVLDPRFISGHSPLAGDYVINGYPPGQEKAYILIPETIVGAAFPEDSKNNIALAISIQQASRNFHLLIRDLTVFEPPLDNKLVVLYAYFGFDLQAQGFGTGDSYDLVAEKLFREGRISRIPDHAYFEDYEKTMMYWNGDSFQTTPTLNRRYVQASSRK